MNQHQFLFIVFTTFIYIQLLYVANCQYTPIWSDNFSTRDPAWICGDGGSLSNSDQINYFAHACYLPWDLDKNYCQNKPCAMVCAVGDEWKNYWLERTTNIAAYSALRLEFSVSAWEMFDPRKCQISYSYDGADDVIEWEKSGNRVQWYNRSIDLGSSTGSASSVTIKLQTYANSNQCEYACYFDNVLLKGIPGLIIHLSFSRNYLINYLNFSSNE